MRQIKMYFGCLLCLFFTNFSFGTSIPITNTIDIKFGGSNIHMLSSQKEEPKLCHFGNTFLGDDVSDGSNSEDTNAISVEEVLGSSSNKSLDVLGDLEHFKKNRKLFCQNNFLHDLKEEEKKRVDKTIERFCGMYSDSVVKGTKFIGLEKEGVFVGMVNIKGEKLFLGRREGTRMFGLLKADQQGTDQLIGYFNMNDEGEVKNAGIVFSPSDKKVGFSIKTGPKKNDRFLFYIPLHNKIDDVYKEIKSNENFRSSKNLDSVKKQVGSMFEEGQRVFDPEEFLAFCNNHHLPLNPITKSKFPSIIKSDKFKKMIEGSKEVYDEAFSFPIYLNGEKREGLLFFVAEGDGSFNLCFGLQALENSSFVPLLVVYFSKGYEVGQSCLFFDYKDSSNSCEINYSPEKLSFNCNFSFPKGKEIIIEENFGEDKVYIVSPLEGNKIKHGEEQGHSLRGLIRSSESRFKWSEENTDFSLILSSSFPPECLCLKIPCCKKGAVFNFVFLPFGWYTLSLKDHIKKGDKEINILNNFLVVCGKFVLLMEEDCVNKDILKVKILEDGKLKIEANFYYPREFRSVDSIYDFIKQIINGAVSVGGSELPFIVSLEVFKESNWNKKVDTETANFLSDVFSTSNVETDSIKEDEKELNTDNNINKEKKGKEIDEVSIQKTVNKKIVYQSKNKKKNERKKRKKQGFLNSIESTESKNSNGLEQVENLDFKQGEEVTIEYFLEGKDGKKEKAR